MLHPIKLQLLQQAGKRPVLQRVGLLPKQQEQLNLQHQQGPIPNQLVPPHNLVLLKLQVPAPPPLLRQVLPPPKQLVLQLKQLLLHNLLLHNLLALLSQVATHKPLPHQLADLELQQVEEQLQQKPLPADPELQVELNQAAQLKQPQRNPLLADPELRQVAQLKQLQQNPQLVPLGLQQRLQHHQQ